MKLMLSDIELERLAALRRSLSFNYETSAKELMAEAASDLGVSVPKVENMLRASVSSMKPVYGMAAYA